MAKSNFLENAILDHVLRGVAFPTLAANNHVALFTSATTDAGGGIEVTGGAYARVAVGRATTAWAAPADNAGAQRTSNSAAITFPSPTVNWGYVGFSALMDAATAGNMLYHGPIGVNTTLAADIAAAATSLTVASASGFPGTSPFNILMDAEVMTVTAGAGTTTWTVTRAVSGAAAAHSAGAIVVVPRLIAANDNAPSFGIGVLTVSEN